MTFSNSEAEPLSSTSSPFTFSAAAAIAVTAGSFSAISKYHFIVCNEISDSVSRLAISIPQKEQCGGNGDTEQRNANT
jgi:hypothetical protein